MGGLSKLAETFSPAYMAYRGVTRKEMPSTSIFSSQGPAAKVATIAGPFAGPAAGLLTMDKKKKNMPIANMVAGGGSSTIKNYG